MSKQSIKKITLFHLIKVLVVAMVIVVGIVILSYRSFFQFVVENKVLSVAEIIKSGLTAHMKAGIMDKRSYFLDEISSIHDIQSIEIIRGDAVTKQFGEPHASEKKLTNNLREILNKKEVYLKWDELDGSVEAIVPYIAHSRGALNCLMCHDVKDGDVLGAVNISMDIYPYQIFVLKNAYIIAGVLLFLAFIIVWNMFYVIERYIRKPLLSIIDDGEIAYGANKDISSEKYESKEFEDVIDNINKFNQHILEKEQQLYHKNIELQELNEEIELTLKETMLAVGRIEEIRSNETKLHTQRVSAISTLIARKYGLDEEQVKLIEIASPLHDIGKIGISDAILNKPYRLTDEETALMQKHSIFGYDILKHSERKILQTAAIIAHEHHEKYDGTGYPRGIKGEEISIYARIIAVVDVLDALLSKRIYKDVWTLEDVIDLFTKEKGKHFDPVLVDIVLENIEEYSEIIRTLSAKKA